MNAHTHIRQGQKFFLDGDFPASIKEFSFALDEESEPLRALLSRGVAYLKLGQLDEAISDFSGVLDGGGDCERAFFYRGIAHLNKGNYEEAITDLTRTLGHNSKRGAAYVARSLAHSELGHVKEAERDIQNAYVSNNVVLGDFIEEYAISRTMFNRSMALFDGDRGPWSQIITVDEMKRIKDYH